MKVLKLSAQGLPQSWISLEEAVLHYAADEVRWEMGAEVAVFHGGHNAITGRQSIITVNSIIGTEGVPRINPFELRPTLTNQKLFARDRIICNEKSYSSIPIHFLQGTPQSRRHVSSNRLIRAWRTPPSQGPRINLARKALAARMGRPVDVHGLHSDCGFWGTHR